jgi:hypothetical protein
MIRIVISGMLVCFSYIASQAQISNVPGAGNEVLREKKYTDVEGSPYLYPDWKSGSVTDKNGKSFPNTLIKYDAYKDVVEINQEGTVLVLSNNLYPTFTISFAEANSNKVIKHTFRSGYDRVPGFGSNVYFEVLGQGEMVVLKKYDVKFIEEVTNNYGTAAQVKRFQRAEKYFLIKNGQAAVEVKLNTKSVLAAIGDKQAELEKYISKEKLKLKNEGDLLALLAYYESL